MYPLARTEQNFIKLKLQETTYEYTEKNKIYNNSTHDMAHGKYIPVVFINSTKINSVH